MSRYFLHHKNTYYYEMPRLYTHKQLIIHISNNINKLQKLTKKKGISLHTWNQNKTIWSMSSHKYTLPNSSILKNNIKHNKKILDRLKSHSLRNMSMFYDCKGTTISKMVISVATECGLCKEFVDKYDHANHRYGEYNECLITQIKQSAINHGLINLEQLFINTPAINQDKLLVEISKSGHVTLIPSAYTSYVDNKTAEIIKMYIHMDGFGDLTLSQFIKRTLNENAE